MNAIKTAKNPDFRLSLGTSAKLIETAGFWFTAFIGPGAAGEVRGIIRKGLDLNPCTWFRH